MCEKCNEIQEKIERYRRLAAQVMDELMTERIGKLVAEMVAEKVNLHSEERE